jgi:hypothetical protein
MGPMFQTAILKDAHKRDDNPSDTIPFNVTTSSLRTTTMATTSTTTMPTEPAWAKALFQPTNRLRDIMWNLLQYEISIAGEAECIEIELLPEFTMAQVLAATDMTWEQCCRVFNGKLVWMAPNVFISSAITFFPWPVYEHTTPALSIGLELDENNHTLGSIIRPSLTARATTTTTFRVYTTEDTNPRDPTVLATCDFLLRLLATIGRVQQQQHHPDGNVFVLRSHQSGDDAVPPPISCATLSRLLQDNDSNIRKLKLSSMILNEEHIRALATVSGSMEIILDDCRLEDDAACRNAFVQCLVRNRGPTQLYRCRIDYPILTAALADNSRVSRLKLVPDEGNRAVTHKEALLRALEHNCGLVKLDLATHGMRYEDLRTLCASLRMHPTLTDLDLRMTRPFIRTAFTRNRLLDVQKAHRTALLADMMKTNTVLLTIRFDVDERDNQIFADTILPHLEMNLYRSRVLAIKKADSQIRRPLLGRALQTRSVRQKPNLLWIFLSGNPDIGFMKSNDEESGQASTLVREENTSVHFPGDKDTYSKRIANANAARSNSSQSPASGKHQIDRSASEKNSRDEIDSMLKRLEANEATISQQGATIKMMQESIDRLTNQLSALVNDPKLLTEVLHSTTRPEASP